VPVSFEEMKRRMNLTPEREAKITARAKQLIAKEMTLQQLRKAQRLTQKKIASTMGVEQDSISRLERRTDMLLSTMSGFVEALGGKLHLVAEFPETGPVTVKFGDLTSRATKTKDTKAEKASSPGRRSSKSTTPTAAGSKIVKAKETVKSSSRKSVTGGLKAAKSAPGRSIKKKHD
jgi:transcriptional regulator with XRE-family HTH domain